MRIIFGMAVVGSAGGSAAAIDYDACPLPVALSLMKQRWDYPDSVAHAFVEICRADKRNRDFSPANVRSGNRIEKIPEIGDGVGERVLEPKQFVGRGRIAAVLDALVEPPFDFPVVVKYAPMSPEIPDLHPLMINWGVYKGALEDSGGSLTPRMVYLSPPLAAARDWRFLVMEKAGVSLADYVAARPGKIPLRDSLYAGRKILSLLQQLHGRNLVHGDVKLKNIVFAKMGDSDLVRDELLLIDFDFTKKFSAEETRAADVHEAVACMLEMNGEVKELLGEFLALAPPRDEADPLATAEPNYAGMLGALSALIEQSAP